MIQECSPRATEPVALPQITCTRELEIKWTGTADTRVRSVKQDSRLLKVGYATLSPTVRVQGRGIEGTLRVPHAPQRSNCHVVLSKTGVSWSEHDHPVRYEDDTAIFRVSHQGLYVVAVSMEAPENPEVPAPSASCFSCGACAPWCTACALM
jgi:hypothetical protein